MKGSKFQLPRPCHPHCNGGIPWNSEQSDGKPHVLIPIPTPPPADLSLLSCHDLKLRSVVVLEHPW